MRQFFLILLIAGFLPSFAQPAGDSTQLPVQASKPLKSFHELIPAGSTVQKGLFRVYQVNNRWYWEIPKNLLRKDFLVVTRIGKGSAVVRDIYGGDELVNLVVCFEQAPGNRLLLRKRLFTSYAGDSTAPLYGAVMRSSEMPILASFPIEAIRNGEGYVIQITEFVLGDNEVFAFDGYQKARAGLTNLFADKSFVSGMRSFLQNLEVTTVKTYQQLIANRKLQTGGTVSQTSHASFELTTSIVQLPEVPMRQRLEDIRVGYFSLRQQDFDTDQSRVANRSYVKRWRLEPKPEDRAKYLRGELVEPAKPIVFYIDPVTPPKWIPYIIQGVEDWQEAFEGAGFVRAIAARSAPDSATDPTWSLYDARYSAIVYKASAIENASGPSIADPRSGEILESHINWYHNVTQILHDWYLVQCGLTDSGAKKMVFEDSLMGQLIRFVVAHEVGHTLGLRHNMAASSAVPVENLRNKEWVEANGFCPSIMDYARFNYVAQPEDSIGRRGLLPRIGVYDKWAIEWGYRWLPQFTSAEEENQYLKKWVKSGQQDKRLWYAPEHFFHDPRVQAEDLGDNAIQASRYAIQNLKRILPQLVTWCADANDSYGHLLRLYEVIQVHHIRYLMHVVNLVGGTYETLGSGVQDGRVFRPVEASRQREAMAFLERHFFTTPTWLLDTTILGQLGETSMAVINNLQTRVIRALIYPPLRLLNMRARNEATYGLQEYRLHEFFDGMKRAIWKEVYARKPIDQYRRNLQWTYIRNLGYSFATKEEHTLLYADAMGLYTSPMPLYEVAMVISGHLKEIRTAIRENAGFIKDKTSRDHLLLLADEITRLLSPVAKNVK